MTARHTKYWLPALLSLLALSIDAQDGRGKPTAWTISDPLAFPIEAQVDTLAYNYQRQAVPSLLSDALATTGNLGAPSLNLIYFNRSDDRTFFFEDAILPYIPTFDTQKYFNVFIPTTQVSYNWGGNRDSGQDRLKGLFAGNVNRRIGVGAMADYLYSKGSYQNQAVKDFIFGFSGYYKGDRYEMTAFFNQYNNLNKENGGITDPLYITDPAVLQGGVDKIDPKNIPVNLQGAHSRVAGKQFFMSHAYKIGYWEEEAVNDTLIRDIYIPVVKFIYSMDYQQARHVFTNSNGSNETTFWQNHYLSTSSSYNKTKYSQWNNTLGISLVEGFKPWVKFNLAAFATYGIRKFHLTDYLPEMVNSAEGGEIINPDLTPLPDGFDTNPKHTQNLLWIGGRLSKDTGKHLRYNAEAKIGMIGDVAGDVDLKGEIQTRFSLLGDTVQLSANALFRNSAPSYLLQHYISNNFVWQNDFGKTRTFRAEGHLHLPWIRTALSAGVENTQNLIYFDVEGMPRQNSGNVQILSFSLDNKLRFGIWNWNNRITLQTSTDQNVLPLPLLSIYSNMFLHFKAFRVLDLQIGADCDYYTRYRGVNYQPATMSFCVGEDWKMGDYPFCNVYITAKLYRTRFFLMMSHINQGWFGSNYFSMPLYPLNPRRFQLGISVDFYN